MSGRRLTEIIKRTIAGMLAAGMILTGMPPLVAEAINELPGQEVSAPGNPGEGNPGEEAAQPGGGNPVPDGSEAGGEENAPGESEPGDGTGGAGSITPDDNDNEPGEANPGDDPADEENTGGDGQDTETPQPETEDGETGMEGEEPAEDGDDPDAVNSVQVSGNDISGNDLAADGAQEGDYEGGYIELPEDRDVSAVNEAVPIYDYEDGIAPLMLDGPQPTDQKYIPPSGTLPLTRDQDPYGSCWAFTAMALAETDMRLNNGASSDADYSELHLAYFSYSGAVDDPLGGLKGDANYNNRAGKNFMELGGNLALAQNVLANWVGAADESTAPYPSGSVKLTEAQLKALVPGDSAFTDAARLQNAFQINLQENPNIAKRMILRYGGVGTSYYNDTSAYYNEESAGYYCDTKETTNHAVTIVGWDDLFPADQFKTKPEGAGAWLIRNSWDAGKDVDSIGRQTYFWMSYYDKSLAAGYAFDFEKTGSYHHNYQYDGSMQTSAVVVPGNAGYAANVFTAHACDQGEKLESVGVTFYKAQTPYTVSVYKNLTDAGDPESGTLIEDASVSGTCGCEGFYTIPLAGSVSLAEGDTFSIVVRYGQAEEDEKVYLPREAPMNAWYRCVTAAEAGQSFYRGENGAWVDLGEKYNANFRIKAYTMDDDGGTGYPVKIELGDDLEDGIGVGVGDSYQASCTVLPRSASDRSVQWESSDPSVATVSAKGLITGISDGTAKITVTCTAHEEGSEPVTASFFVDVYSALQSIKVTGVSRVTSGSTVTYRTVRSPSSVDAAEVEWSSSDERVVTVDSKGVVTGVSPGYATITAGIGAVKGTKKITCEFPDVTYTVKSSINGFRIIWEGNSCAAGYRLYRAVGESWTNPKLLTEITPDGSKTYDYLDQDVTANQSYIYQLEADVRYIKDSGYEEKTLSSGAHRYKMPEYYSITYHLNGGENAKGNPVSYRVGAEPKAINDPQRTGYQFNGWYFDEGLTQKLEGNTIPSEQRGNVDLYAGWTPIVTGIRIGRPARTTYRTGERLDVSGGEVYPEAVEPMEPVALEEEMISGFDSSAPGICSVTVRYKGVEESFDTLIVAEPQLNAVLGQQLGELTPPADRYGVYVWANAATTLLREGLYTAPVSYIPNDTEAFQRLDHLTAQITVTSAPPDDNPACDVMFDVQGRGAAPATLRNVRAGSTIEEPAHPTADGYTFIGWCKDAACTQEWKFDADIVQTDMTLYAKWLRKSAQENSQFQLQEIEDIYYYTGKALKPAVNVYDGETVLKAGRDYTVKYVNNTNVNAGGVWKKGDGTGADFNPDIPYVQITGKGNYSDEIKVNFDIHPAAIADGKGNLAEKAALRYTDQFTAVNRELKPFGSIRYYKTMKLNQDYTLTLTAKDVRDNAGGAVPEGTVFDGAVIPKEYEGEFTLTVNGIGNYTGSISRSVYVTDKLHLMKNARITLGKNQKNVELVEGKAELTPGKEDSADTFTVKFGKTVLTPDSDYYVEYQGNDRVGKATLVVRGRGAYAGTKTVTFNIKGQPFTAGHIQVTGIEQKVYTGRSLIQNDAALVYHAGKPDEKRLIYGTDYTISYAKNINKGTATMTFTGRKEAGFSGSFRKSFRILAAPIDSTDAVKRGDGWNAIVAEYSKAGAKPVSEIVLTNAGGIRLQNGKDYTLSYKNNRNVAKPTDEKAPTIIVRGKGNYQGTFSVPFTISSADLHDGISSGEITIKTTAVAYQPKKPDDYVYKPTVRLMEGKAALRAGVDYTVTYKNNTQAAYEAYIRSVDAGTDEPALAPQAVISAGSGNAYFMTQEWSEPLTIYRHKLTKANLRVEYAASDCVYTGGQVTPKVQVSYLGENGTTKLVQGEDYTVSYGTNVKAGRNAGKITISGTGTLYGGDVTVNFEILRKKIY